MRRRGMSCSYKRSSGDVVFRNIVGFLGVHAVELNQPPPKKNIYIYIEF